MIKEIFCDLDGTLYNEGQGITERDLGAIRTAQEFGIIFNIATGRVFTHTQKIVEDANIEGYSICENGSFIYNAKGECLFRGTLDDSSIRNIIKAYNSLDYIDDDDILYFKYDGNVVLQKDGGYGDYFSNGYFVMDDILDRQTYESKVGNMGVFSKDFSKLEKIVDDLKKQFGSELDIYISGPVTLNIVPKGISKFEAIKMICKKKNVSIDEIVTIGDSPNDISMLKNVKMSFAMESASDSVKSVAGYMTPTVADAVKMVIDFNQMEDK